MRLITYQTDSGPRLGVIRGRESAAEEEVFMPVPSMDMLSLIRAGEAGMERVRASTGFIRPLASVTLLAPIPNPRRNIFCVGRNYAEHAAESLRARGEQVKMPDVPMFFTKATTAVNGPFADIPFDPKVSEQMDWEAELAVVIGRRGKNIPREKAMEHVFGYTVVNDVSARDVQFAHGGQFFKGKSLDGACPMGPWIVTRDEVPDPHALTVHCRVNGVTKQAASTAEFIFNIPVLIEWLSRGMTLVSGDIIATGTPAGVGFARQPPEFLRPGDVVECEVEGVGIIRNKVAAN